MGAFGRPFFAAFIGYYFMRKLLPHRFNLFALILISIVFALWANLRSPELYGTDYHLWMNMFINALTFSVLIFLFKGKFWKRFIVYWYFEIIHLMCETIAFVPVLLYYDGEPDARMEIFYMLAIVFLYLLLGSLSVKIWRRLLLLKFHPFYLLFIALPIGQMYALSNVMHPGMGDWFFGIAFMITGDAEMSYGILSLFGVSVSLVAFVTLFCYILSHEKRAAVEAELQEIKRVMALEQSHYLEIELQSEEMAKIRHDFNNQLASIIRLARTGDDDVAREMINDLSKAIR